MDKLLVLNTFTKVVDAGGFAAAARLLEVSPATVTEQIKALEQDLRTRLFTRTTRKVSLTDEGAAYYEQAIHILERVYEADAMVSPERMVAKGLLRVALPPLLGTLVVLPAMAGFLARHPQLRVETMLSAGVAPFRAQNLDLALQLSCEIEPDWVFRPLGLCPIVTVASPQYLAGRRRPESPADLAGFDLIAARPLKGEPTAAFRFERERRAIVQEARPRLVVDAGEAQRVLALAHCGLTQCPLYAVQDLLAGGRLVRVLQDWEWSGPPVGIVQAAHRYVLPRVEVFVEFVRGLLADQVQPYRPDWVR